MKKLVFSVILILVSVVAVQRSQAIGGESLGCFVNDGTAGSYSAGSCISGIPRSSYTANYKVLSASGSYTYAWTYNRPVVTGCTSTTDYCVLSVNSNMSDQTVTATVTLSQSGLQNTVSADATIQAVCYLGSQIVYC
jgi:K+-transporting ATPase c subunit